VRTEKRLKKISHQKTEIIFQEMKIRKKKKNTGHSTCHWETDIQWKNFPPK